MLKEFPQGLDDFRFFEADTRRQHREQTRRVALDIAVRVGQQGAAKRDHVGHALAKEQAKLEDIIQATDGHNLERTLAHVPPKGDDPALDALEPRGAPHAVALGADRVGRPSVGVAAAGHRISTGC